MQQKAVIEQEATPTYLQPPPLHPTLNPPDTSSNLPPMYPSLASCGACVMRPLLLNCTSPSPRLPARTPLTFLNPKFSP